MTSHGVTLTTAVLAALYAGNAAAEAPVSGGSIQIATGVEAGDSGAGTHLRRARTRLSASIEWMGDDWDKHGIMASIHADVEPRSAFGGELRYFYRLGAPALVFAGFSGNFTPRTLFGAVAGGRWHFLRRARGALYLEPSFAVLPVGSDLPTDHPVLLGLLAFGVRANLLATP